jgi:hypothetical protein
MSYELQARSYNLWLREFGIMSYELKDTKYIIESVPADDSTVQPYTVV